MCPANERRRYIVMSSVIGWSHTPTYTDSLHNEVVSVMTFQFLWRYKSLSKSVDDSVRKLHLDPSHGSTRDVNPFTSSEYWYSRKKFTVFRFSTELVNCDPCNNKSVFKCSDGLIQCKWQAMSQWSKTISPSFWSCYWIHGLRMITLN